MTEQTECRWSWCKPDKIGQWWWGHDNKDEPNDQRIVDVTNPTSKIAGWWAYIGPITPEPLPPKKNVTQTMWMVPVLNWHYGGNPTFIQRWLSTYDTIPPGAIETVQKREVEL